MALTSGQGGLKSSQPKLLQGNIKVEIGASPTMFSEVKGVEIEGEALCRKISGVREGDTAPENAESSTQELSADTLTISLHSGPLAGLPSSWWEFLLRQPACPHRA